MSIKILHWEIPLYGLLFYAGIAMAAIVGLIISRKRKIPTFDMVSSAVYAMIGALLGAKILFWAVSFKEIIGLFKLYPVEDVLFSIIKGGFVFYGGLIGGALGLFIYVKQFKMRLSDFVDVFATVIPLGHAIGRVGCFFAGCCYGIEYHGPFSHTYTESLGTTPVGVPLLPVQLIESACLIVLFFIMIYLFFKKASVGYFCASVYAIGYSIIRFTLEFFRGDKERGVLMGLSTSQWISVMIILVVMALSILKFKSKKRA